MSSSAIANYLHCSVGRVNYWLLRHNISKRTISDAIYQKWNPNGDPFGLYKPKTLQEAVLYGLGVGLYWGEGTKSNKLSVRLGNTDPRLIKKFMQFLKTFYQVDKNKLHFGLQIFGDMNAKNVLQFCTRSLGVSSKQFYKVTITPYRGIGNYRKKTEYGVLTIFFNNKKLRDIICRAIDEESMH